MPKVSVVMPVYNSAKYLMESISSIQNQTFTDWEFIIVNEFGSNDGSANIIKTFAKKDNRIILIQNKKRLGLAESLNVGIESAKGEYIARVDADDPSYSNRLEKQVEFMDANTDVDFCGTLQRSVTPNGNNIQRVPCEEEELKAALIFGCEISHCSVMLRKSVFKKNGWKYNPNALGEDFELWTRIMTESKFVNLNEVLVDHRWGYDNISIEKGESLRQEVREISSRTLKLLDIDMSDKDLMLLSGWRNRPEKHARENVTEFLKNGFELLELIENQNDKIKVFDQKALRKILYKRWNWICQTCGVKFKEYEYNEFIGREIDNKPEVSVVIPVCNSMKYLREAVDSIIDQSYLNWEIIAVNEFESEDGSAEIIKMYAKYCENIKIIQNDSKLGLGESLNKGIKIARGKYIARLDADDIANTQRLKKQVRFMEENPKVGICGTYQKHFGKNVNWIHRPPISSEQCKANLLFYCDICHSTLIMRKDIILDNNLFYDNKYYAEDYELWTRAVKITEFATIPEVLGDYREGVNNVTNIKREKLVEESGHIIAEQIKRNLGIDILYENHYLLGGWENLYYNEKDKKQKVLMLDKLKEILLNIWMKNKKVKFYDNQSLLNILSAKWRWAKYNEDWTNKQNVFDITEVFDEKYRPSLKVKFKRFLRNNPTIKMKIKKIIKKILKPLLNPIKTRLESILNRTEKNICKHIDRITWDRFKRIERKVDNKVWDAEKRIIKLQKIVLEQMYRENRTTLNKNEKIRIVFLFQIASFWPGWESFYKECLKDHRFDVKFVFLNETVVEKAQMKSASEFLENSDIEYINMEDFDTDIYKPHVMVYQTPYDRWHRKYNNWSESIKRKGIRIVYIPYGIEIADTNDAHHAHFYEDVIKNSWRVYTFSEAMREDYRLYCENKNAIKALGVPKFDGLFNKERFRLNNDITSRANGRKIVLWKLHFPKQIKENNKIRRVTPYIDEYIKFANVLSEYNEFFFIFMPHPRFCEENGCKKTQEKARQLIRKIKMIENAYIDMDDDYRNSLLNSDYIIVDRSAIMVEAAAVGVPILYMNNKDYYEPTTKAITPLIDSYYQGSTCEDMMEFLEMSKNNEDPQKIQRERAFNQCIPFFDGNCGKRIKDDILESLENERESGAIEISLVELQEQISNLEKEMNNIASNHIEIDEQNIGCNKI